MWRKLLMTRIEDVRGSLQVHPTKKYVEEKELNPQFITLHHSGTETGHAQTFANYHVSKMDWPGIGYHFVVLRNGTIQWCHDLRVRCYHTSGRNTRNIGVCMVGEGLFTKRQRNALKNLVYALSIHYQLSSSKILGHREHPSQKTLCPAMNLDQFRKEIDSLLFHSLTQLTPSTAIPKTVRKGARGQDVMNLQNALALKGYSLHRFGADGIFGAETERAVKKFQRDHHLKMDGIVGPKTWEKIIS
ncbi:hypothetical protein CR194_00225 [Salipaludibacillus keqinensis]|uniref:Autolysin n=1 Tax=Salipaludibacillus keqinensis TaxID=2045207 RepID=A0A323TWR4_9BACI|nr:N-acetylmuramoyl-L-alanine amidase [Salipaludibacillus keqinensis]PYZ94005.1 hypothetical protein CR194_00225 [Salipaludibacillus keqinensis]